MMFNHDKYLEKSISVGICQPPSPHSVETGQALTRRDLRPMSAITWTQALTLRGGRRLEREARQRVLKTVIGEAETSESLSS